MASVLRARTNTRPLRGFDVFRVVPPPTILPLTAKKAEGGVFLVLFGFPADRLGMCLSSCIEFAFERVDLDRCMYVASRLCDQRRKNDGVGVCGHSSVPPPRNALKRTKSMARYYSTAVKEAFFVDGFNWMVSPD